MKKYKNYLIDLDGTIYLGKKRIDGAQNFIDRINENNQLQYFFLTNNSTRTPQMIVDDLAENHGIKTNPQQIITPSLATANYLVEHSKRDGRDIVDSSAYVIGEVGLKNEIFKTGVRYNEQNPDYVVMGMDHDVTYHKFEVATLAILDGAKFIGTNADTNLPNEKGLTPGAGSVISFVETSTQRKAKYIGKPEREIADYALRKYKLNRDETIIVGDNYNTDIKCGINSDMDSLLVYTGVSTKEDIVKVDIKPTYEVDNLNEWEF